MLLDLLAIGLLIGFTILGSHRGAFRSGVGLVSWVGGYAAAALCTARLAPVISDVTGLPFLLSLGVAGVSILALALGLGLALIKFIEHRRGEESFRTGGDRFGGAIFGALQGGLVVLLVGWLGQWLTAASQAGVPIPGGTAATSVTSRVSGRVIEAGMNAALDEADPASRLATNLAVRPAESLPRLQAILENPRIQTLMRDASFWNHVSAGRLNEALNEPGFLGIAFDATLRGELAEVGIVRAEAAEDPLRFREDSMAAIEQIGPWLGTIASSPELEILAADPDVQKALAEGDTLTLLTHPEIRSLMERVMSAPESSAEL
jgi:uncharacterized membrane protein required for colicin V production